MDQKTQNKGTLYIVSTPIGNRKDITLRASEVLQNCDLVVGEEMKEATRVLRYLNLSKNIDLLNEHNEKEKIFELIELLNKGKTIALISDCGTPIFADPGIDLLRAALSNQINVVVVPGASSIMTAIVRSGFDLNRFLYVGFLDRDSEKRKKEIKNLENFPYTFIIMDTPYRLKVLLEDLKEVLPYRRAYIGMNLTMPSETHHYGTFTELFEKFKSIKIKQEYVIVVEGNKLVEKIANETFLPTKLTKQNKKDRPQGFNKQKKSKPSFNKQKTSRTKETTDRKKINLKKFSKSKNDKSKQ